MDSSLEYTLYNFQPGIKLENECRICKDESLEKQRETEHEELIVCSECKSKGHPTCLDLNGDMVRVIKTYPWQCMECKTCVQCMDPYDEVCYKYCKSLYIRVILFCENPLSDFKLLQRC